MAEFEKAAGNKRRGLTRDFLVGSGAALTAGALGVCAPKSAAAVTQTTPEANPSYAQSTGYIVYDSRLCLGSQSCMFACSMTHESEENPSPPRIQSIRNAPSLTKYPDGVVVSVCRQCVSALCVQNCPTGACHVDEANGNVRMIDQSKCIGCRRCINSCPQWPPRTVWNSVKKKSTKYDLCANAPFWSNQGDPRGNQACAEICPVKALKLVKEAPTQMDVAGYDVNLAPLPMAKIPPKPAPKQN